jgi:hypothetical protein
LLKSNDVLLDIAETILGRYYQGSPNRKAEMIHLEFTGPYSWFGAPDVPSLHHAAERHEPGIYIETVSLPKGHLVYYVGETGKSFIERMKDHYKNRVNAEYRIYAAEEFARGEKKVIWSGIWNPPGYENSPEGRALRNSKAVCRANRERLKESAEALVRVIRYHFAALNCEKRVRQRIEGELAGRIQVSSPVSNFYSNGVSYCRRRIGEEPIDCTASSRALILGFPKRLSA